MTGRVIQQGVPVLRALRVAAPIIAVIAVYFWRGAVIDALDRLMGLGFVFTVVHVYSTAAVRLLAVLALVIGFGVLLVATARIRPDRRRHLVVSLLSLIVVGLLVYLLRGPRNAIAAAALGGSLVYLNALPVENLRRLVHGPSIGRLVNAGFWVAIGAEFLLPRPYQVWLNPAAADPPNPVWRWGPGVVIVSVLVALTLPFPLLMRTGETLFMSDAARIVYGPGYSTYSRFDVSDLARDPVTGDIYLCGDRQLTVAVLRHGADRPEDTGIGNDGNEFCDFSGPTGMFVTVDGATNTVLIVDPATRAVVNRIDLPDLPDGEVFVAAHASEPLLVVASENIDHERPDGGGGPEIRVIDLGTSDIIRSIDDDVGYILLHPDLPVLYINHFAMHRGVRAYDIATGELLATSVLFGRSDRMAFDPRRDQVLATAPENGQVWRFDARTLQALPPIGTLFGVRGLAVDPERDLLLTSSLLTNQIEVIDLKTGASLRRYRLGPWLRDILVVPEEGRAYVASRYGVYEVDYAAGLP